MFIPGKPIENLIRRLRSLLNFKSADDPIQFFHPTFREYLLTSGRDSFVISIPNSHHLIAAQYFTFMQKELKQDICGTGLYIGHLPNNDDNPGLLTTLRSRVTAPLLYSVKYWFHHMEYCLESEEILDCVLEFFRKSLLHWVEALSLSNQLVIGMKGLSALRKGIQRATVHRVPSSRLSQIEDWCNDIARLIQSQQRILKVNAFAIYTSVIASAPREGILYHCYGERSDGSSPKMLQGWRKRWPSHIILSGHLLEVNALAISNDGIMIVSGSNDKTLRMWDAFTGASLYTPIHHASEVSALSCFPDGSRVVSGLVEGQLAIWEVATGKKLSPISQENTDAITQLAISPDGTRLVTASRDRTLRLWDAKDISATPVMIQGHRRAVSAVSFSPDGLLLASGSVDCTLRLWDGITGASVGRSLRGHHHCVNCIAFSPSEDTIVSASSDLTLRLWSVESQMSIGRPFQGHSGWVLCVSFSPDGTQIASGSNDKIIRLWDVATKECISHLSGHLDAVSCLVFLPEGNKIVSGSYDHTVRIWDLGVQQGEQDETQKGHKRSVRGIAFSPRGSKIATCSADRTLQVWNATNGDFLGEMRGHNGDVNCLAFSPDGATIVSGSNDGSLRLWDVIRGKCLKVEEGNNFIHCVAFSHDGGRVISGGSTLQLYNSKTGVRIGNYFRDRSGIITCVAFSSDDTKIALGCSGYIVQLWDITGRELRNYSKSHSGYVNLTAFSTDNLYILSACNAEISVWSISSPEIVARFPHFQFSPTKLLPPHIRHLKLELAATSNSFFQTGATTQSVRRYFNNLHIPQVYFDHDSHTITISSSSDYVYHIPADFRVSEWKGNGEVIVLACYDGRVMILDFSHLSL